MPPSTPVPHVVFDLRDPSQTGIGRVARETVRAYTSLFPEDAVTVLREGGRRYSLRAQREWFQLRRTHQGATWVWFHWDVPWVGMPFRSVVYVHDLIHLHRAGFVKRTVARRWIGHALRHAGAVATGTHAAASLLPRQATVIPHGVNLTFPHPWTGDGAYLLTVGEPRPYKNFALVETLARQLGLPWKHAWRVSDAELATLYAGARAVLVPSREEGFGLPVLEAFAAGAPVVASDIPPIREVSGGLATLLHPDDHEGWRRAITAVWASPGSAAPRLARAAQFTWESSARQLRALLVSVSA
ncbi:MAG: glycosyltransferase family 1 protein [Gemmatimonadota bacterium]|nr:glycosyltransferase family 1 protein [Gemmatimonadota bacterium]